MTVYNKARNDAPPGAVYVGRPTKWGNPYHITPTRSREKSIEAFRVMLRGSPAFVDAIRRELKGKDLVCWCAPHACHADILQQVANGGAP